MSKPSEKTWIIVLLHNNVLLCVDLLYETKPINICGCNVTKCKSPKCVNTAEGHCISNLSLSKILISYSHTFHANKRHEGKKSPSLNHTWWKSNLRKGSDSSHQLPDRDLIVDRRILPSCASCWARCHAWNSWSENSCDCDPRERGWGSSAMSKESDCIKTQQDSAAENVNCGISLLTAGGLGDKQNPLSCVQFIVNLLQF